MPVSDRYTAYIIDRLAAITLIKTRKMFNGVGIYHNEKLFAFLINNNVYFKTDHDSSREFRAFGIQPFQPDSSHTIGSPYYQLPEVVLNNKKVLQKWVLKACRIAEADQFSMTG